MISRAVEMDLLCELASELVERAHYKKHFSKQHSFKDLNGDIRYIDEVQDEFNIVLDILDEYLNGEKSE